MDRKTTLRISWLLAGALILIVGSASVVYASGAPAGPTWWGLSQEKLWDLLWRALNFAALLIILIKFGAKPIANILNQRQNTIKQQFEDLEARRAEADETYRSFEDKLTRIDQDVTQIIEKAIAQGEAEKERIIQEANRAAEDIKRQADMAIQHELSAATLKLREEVAGQAIAMAEELIRKNLQKDDQVKLVENYLEKVGKIQ